MQTIQSSQNCLLLLAFEALKTCTCKPLDAWLLNTAYTVYRRAFMQAQQGLPTELVLKYSKKSGLHCFIMCAKWWLLLWHSACLTHLGRVQCRSLPLCLSLPLLLSRVLLHHQHMNE